MNKNNCTPFFSLKNKPTLGNILNDNKTLTSIHRPTLGGNIHCGAKRANPYPVFLNLSLSELHGGDVEGVVGHEAEGHLQQPLLTLLLGLVEVVVLIVQTLLRFHQVLNVKRIQLLSNQNSTREIVLDFLLLFSFKALM